MKVKTWLPACLLFALLICIGWTVLSDLRRQPDDRNARRWADPPRKGYFPPDEMDVPAVEDPPLLYAEEALIDDEAVIIGIVVNGEARAYLRQAFDGGPDRHVVSDTIETTPVAITHCDRIRCTRVLIASRPEDPLELRCGGWREDQTMELIVNGQRFSQKSAEIPLDDVPFLELPWGMWREFFPDTTIYLGDWKQPERIPQPEERIEEPRQSIADFFRPTLG